MSDSLFTVITDEATNPLLGIDTSFRSYLNAYTRSFSNHVVGGALDYAFDSDFAVRQKIQSLSAWGRLSKSIDSQDITQEAKFLFSKCNQAGMLKYPEIYDIVRKCADRLELRLPIVFVREDTDAKQIYSIASSIIEPCIVITSALASDCTEEELTILIGMECGKIQNNHCIYSFAGSYISNSPAKFKPVERSYNHTIGNQLICALSEWIELGDITIDRAAMICCDEPEKYGEILSGLLNRNFTDMYGRNDAGTDYTAAKTYFDTNRNVGSRYLKAECGLKRSEKRIAAALEFTRCYALYQWRSDLEKPENVLISAEECNIRCNIICGAAVM